MLLPTHSFQLAARTRLTPTVRQCLANRGFAMSSSPPPITPSSLSDHDIMEGAMDEYKSATPRPSFNHRAKSAYRAAPAASIARTGETYNAFRQHSFVKPSDFNRKNRLEKPRTPSIKANPPGHRESHFADPFLQLNIDPRLVPENTLLLSNFVTRMGKIKPRGETKLSIRSQRMIGKTIKRARMMGLIPIFSQPKQRSRGGYT